jgi:ribosome-associated toxin RatA of RatAB toxin-antitoxin module
MEKHNSTYIFPTFFIFLAAITFFSFIPSSYADRIITLQKVSDVSEESLLNTISDVSEYPQIFPDNVKYAKVLDNNTKLVEMNAGINGMFFDTQAICKTDQNGNYIVEVVSGDLRGTTMTTKLEKTWGFHGQKDGGTIANMALDVKTSGFLSWMINFVPDSSVSDALGYGFDKFIQHIKTQ